MDKLMKKVVALLLLIATVAVQLDAGGPTNQKPVRKRKMVAKESPAVHVDKEAAALDQILAYAKSVTQATGTTAFADRKKGIAEIRKLLKELDPGIKDAIIDDINIVLLTGRSESSQIEGRKALVRIIATINAINAQAHVVAVMEEGRKAIEFAPVEMKDAIIAEQVQKVQVAEAQAEQAGIANRTINGVKTVLAAPGNYFFGEERSTAKTLFEVAVGTAVAGATAYGIYRFTPEGTTAQLQSVYEAAKAKLGFGPAVEPQKEQGRPSYKTKEAKKQAAERPGVKEIGKKTEWYRMTPEERKEKGLDQLSLSDRYGESTKQMLTSDDEAALDLYGQATFPRLPADTKRKISSAVERGREFLNKEKADFDLEKQLERQERLATEAALRGGSLVNSQKTPQIPISTSPEKQQIEKELKKLDEQRSQLIGERKILSDEDPLKHELGNEVQKLDEQIAANIQLWKEANKEENPDLLSRGMQAVKGFFNPQNQALQKLEFGDEDRIESAREAGLAEYKQLQEGKERFNILAQERAAELAQQQEEQMEQSEGFEAVEQ